MPTPTEIKKLTTIAEAEFERLGITDEMFSSVINYLIQIGALKHCGNRSGCKGPCGSGQYCQEVARGNCLCVKEP
jgi:hypothetical protein